MRTVTFEELTEILDNVPQQQEPPGIKPFACGTQFGDWTTANCERCTKGASPGKWPTCTIETALLEAYFDNGRITEDIARRMGWEPGNRYNWRCGEFEIAEQIRDQLEGADTGNFKDLQ